MNVSRLRTIDRARLGARVGALTGERMAEVLRGLALVLGIETAADD